MDYKRNFQVGFTVNEEEKKQIEDNAKNLGLSLSGYLRYVAIHKEKKED